MARSTVEQLPPEIRARVEDWLREFRAGRLQLDQVLVRLDAQFGDQGVPLPSRSALHRHSQKVQQLAERVQRSRDIADQLIAQIGPDMTDGKGLQVLVQGFQSLVFDLMANLNEDQTLDPENLMFLAKSIQAVTSARKTDADLHLKLKEQATRAAAEKAGQAAKAQGLSAEVVKAIETAVLGVQA